MAAALRRTVAVFRAEYLGPFVERQVGGHQNAVDDIRERRQLRALRRLASPISRRFRMQQYLGNRLAIDPELARSFPSAQTLTMTRQSHSSIKIHSVHPPPSIRSILTKAIRRSHIGPPPQPDKPAASLGDYCSAVLTGPIVLQDPIDDPRECIQLRTPRGAGDIPAAPRTTASCAPSCGPTRTPARPRGCSSPRHDTPAGPARTSPPDTSPRLPVRATLTEGYTRSHSWSAAAGSTGRLSGGLLRRRSHMEVTISKANCLRHSPPKLRVLYPIQTDQHLSKSVPGP